MVTTVSNQVDFKNTKVGCGGFYLLDSCSDIQSTQNSSRYRWIVTDKQLIKRHFIAIAMSVEYSEGRWKNKHAVTWLPQTDSDSNSGLCACIRSGRRQIFPLVIFLAQSLNMPPRGVADILAFSVPALRTNILNWILLIKILLPLQSENALNISRDGRLSPFEPVPDVSNPQFFFSFTKPEIKSSANSSISSHLEQLGRKNWMHQFFRLLWSWSARKWQWKWRHMLIYWNCLGPIVHEFQYLNYLKSFEEKKW